VRLIGPPASKSASCRIAQALKMAEEAEVDLVEIAPLGQAARVQVMTTQVQYLDYGKSSFLFF